MLATLQRMVSRLISSKTAASKLLPIERALKTDILNVWRLTGNSYCPWMVEQERGRTLSFLSGCWLNEDKKNPVIGGRGEPPDKSDPRPLKVSDNRAYMGIISGYMGIYCHICIRISSRGGRFAEPPGMSPKHNTNIICQFGCRRYMYHYHILYKIIRCIT